MEKRSSILNPSLCLHDKAEAYREECVEKAIDKVQDRIPQIMELQFNNMNIEKMNKKFKFPGFHPDSFVCWVRRNLDGVRSVADGRQIQIEVSRAD